VSHRFDQTPSVLRPQTVRLALERGDFEFLLGDQRLVIRFFRQGDGEARFDCGSFGRRVVFRHIVGVRGKPDSQTTLALAICQVDRAAAHARNRGRCRSRHRHDPPDAATDRKSAEITIKVCDGAMSFVYACDLACDLEFRSRCLKLLRFQMKIRSVCRVNPGRSMHCAAPRVQAAAQWRATSAWVAIQQLPLALM
jgi:hypothetical protein